MKAGGVVWPCPQLCAVAMLGKNGGGPQNGLLAVQTSAVEGDSFPARLDPSRLSLFAG